MKYFGNMNYCFQLRGITKYAMIGASMPPETMHVISLIPLIILESSSIFFGLEVDSRGKTKLAFHLGAIIIIIIILA